MDASNLQASAEECAQMPISLHRENTWFNTVLSAAYQKRRVKNIEIYLGEGVCLMSPDEVVENLKGLGATISRKTLYNWERGGLIPTATFRNSKTTDYPDHVIAEAFAVFCLKRGVFRMRDADVKRVRDLAAQLYTRSSEWAEGDNPDNFYLFSQELHSPLIQWVCAVEKVRRALPPEQPIKVVFVREFGERGEEFVGVVVEKSAKDILAFKQLMADKLKRKLLE